MRKLTRSPYSKGKLPKDMLEEELLLYLDSWLRHFLQPSPVLVFVLEHKETNSPHQLQAIFSEPLMVAYQEVYTHPFVLILSKLPTHSHFWEATFQDERISIHSVISHSKYLCESSDWNGVLNTTLAATMQSASGFCTGSISLTPFAAARVMHQ